MPKGIPRATPDRIAYAQFATRGVLTRLALMFDANSDEKFSGKQIQEILVGVCVAVGRPGEIPELDTVQQQIAQAIEVDG